MLLRLRDVVVSDDGKGTPLRVSGEYREDERKRTNR
jgi:hypothetical protein